MGFMSKRAPAEKGIPLSSTTTTTGKTPLPGKPLDIASEESVRAYEADAAELEAAVAGTMAAGGDADAVFGEISEGGPNYRAVGWKCESLVRAVGDLALMIWGGVATAVLLFKTQIGLGVLSVPSVLATLGIVPGTSRFVAL